MVQNKSHVIIKEYYECYSIFIIADVALNMTSGATAATGYLVSRMQENEQTISPEFSIDHNAM